jgi:drug/metabolite transporter (DMT)-like permease
MVWLVKNTVGLGIALTSLAYMMFTFHDAAIKLLVATLPVWQILFFRSLTILACSLAIGRKALIIRCATSPVLKPMAFRSLMLLGAWLSYYNAARFLPLGDATTLYFAAPIVAMLLAVPVLKEKVTAARWAAVLIGFVGVIVASDPSGLKISWPVYLALQAACLWAFSTVLLRKTAMAETSLVQMTLTNVGFLLMTACALPFVWVNVSWPQAALMLAVGLGSGIAQFVFLEGMRRAPLSVLAPFEYTSLVWAFILGYLIWGDLPKHQVVTGAVLIMAAGTIVIISERWGPRLRARKNPPPAIG